MLRRSREASALTRGAERRPVLSDDARGKHYALGRGDYVVSGVAVAAAGGGAPVVDRAFTGGAFTVGASDAVLVPVVYDQRDFTQIAGFTGTPAAYMARAYSRPNQIFTPASAADPDGAGSYRDIDRQQVIAVHESGHIFGAPHCDDVGNGSGGALQGYVMCAGEKHARYPGQFVWHSTSTAVMKPHWD
jgi:hypothetical protein